MLFECHDCRQWLMVSHTPNSPTAQSQISNLLQSVPDSTSYLIYVEFTLVYYAGEEYYQRDLKQIEKNCYDDQKVPSIREQLPPEEECRFGQNQWEFIVQPIPNGGLFFNIHSKGLIVVTPQKPVFLLAWLLRFVHFDLIQRHDGGPQRSP